METNNLLIKDDSTGILLHSGDSSDFKIDCDVLSDLDIDTLAYLITKRLGRKPIKKTVGIPTGGLRLAQALDNYMQNDYVSDGFVLLVNDVFTTGKSIEEYRKRIIEEESTCAVHGVVIFARNKTPNWIVPVFSMERFFV